MPDAKTGGYREQLAQGGVIERLFDEFDGHLKSQGYLAMGGQIIDASIVPVPKQRNSRDDNAKIKAGEVPEGWAKQPARRAQKDTDARWTKKHGRSHFGYKNHINVDRRHKLVRRYQVDSASVHDSQVVADILDPDNTAASVWADSAYRSAEIEAKLAEKGLKSRIHRKGRRGRPLSEREHQGETEPVRRFGRGSSTCSEPRATTWAGRWCAASAWCGPRPGSGSRTSPTTCGAWCTWSAAR